jgi:tripartite-type tricarboxylate transporter receptor subunit TctC
MHMKGITRKLVIIAGVALLCGWSTSLSAQPDPKDYPNKPIRVIVPNTPGGPPDMTIRILSPKLSASLGQPIVIDNRAGAGGIIGTVAVAKSPPDGYTWLFATASHNNNPAFNKNSNYDPVRDFTPVTMAAWNFGQVLIVHPSVPVKTAQELIAFAKQHPGKLTYGSAGIGTASHIPAEVMKSMTGIDILGVQYKGAALAMNDLLGGHIDVLFVGTQIALPLIQDGRVRALAMTGSKRWKGLPDLPTLQECGLKDFNIINWFGLWLPAGASPKLVSRIYTETARALGDADIKQQFDKLGLEPVGSKPEEFARFVAQDAALMFRIGRMIEAKSK